MMLSLVSYLNRGCKEFGLNLQVNHSVAFSNGVTINSPVMIVGSGLGKGILVFTETNSVWPFRQQIIDDGYGYSVLEDDLSYHFDPISFKEMIVDWGWKP